VFDGLLRTDVLTGPVPVTVYALAAAALVALLARRPSLRWLRRAAIAVACGLAAAVATWLVAVRWLDLFGGSLGLANYLWIAAAFCGVALCVASIGRAPRWRTAVAFVGIPLFLVAATLGINADYGLNRTLGGLLAITVPKPIALTPPTASDDGYDTALWKHWTPPADMPSHGVTGTAHIPATVSGFSARDAGLYLPPAARVKHPPVLPLVVMMMGQPGNPDPEPIADVLDRFAAAHHGLAPIVVVADQIGDPTHDTLCMDTSRFGKVETYITRDVAEWAERHLAVTHDHRFWTAAGYSNGGLCALKFGVERPHLFSTILDISGEEFPGAEHPDATLRDVFHGDQAAYDAAKPLVTLRDSPRPGTTAVFTASSDDPAYRRVAQRCAQAARAAGMNTAFVEVKGGGHGIGTLTGGLEGGFRLLYPLLGLEQPH
jgi:poly(3-hydroxybutyrate) depolymerase